MINAAIVGASGYAGAETARILAGHPDVQLTVLTSRQHAGVRFDRIYPAMRGYLDLVFEAYDAERVCERADVIFTALPHKLPMALVPEMIRRGKKVIDLSADFRFRNAAIYESHYQPHTAPELLPRAVYGLSEVYGDAIRQADLIGNPGCYPTSVLLPLVPLLKNDLIDSDTLIADAKSGVSGAGRSPSLTTHFCEVQESYKAYKVAAHRHNPEMNAVLSSEAGREVLITFVPHLVPMSRGMLTTTYARLNTGVDAGAVEACLADYYAGRAFIRLRRADHLPDTRDVRGTNFCDIGVRVDPAAGRLILISVIDNLVKGAAGQAVQNMNLMFGLSETAGLAGVPFPL
jgi:N-acetyl-gamma-glutamyl-phosphate reductase